MMINWFLFQAVKQFIDLCNNLSSISNDNDSAFTCSTTPRRRNVTARTALKFLYARKFDVHRAVTLYEQHHQIRLREGLYNIDPYLEPLHTELQTGKFTILVRVVIYFRLSIYFLRHLTSFCWFFLLLRTYF